MFLRTYPSGREVWWIRFQFEGRDVKKKGGATKDEARRKLRATLTDLERGVTNLKPKTKDTLAGVFEAYRSIAQRQRNYPKTEAYYQWWTAYAGSVAVRALTPFHVEQAQSRLLESGKSPATVNHYTSWLRAILNREVRLGHLLSNPVSKVRQLRESKGRTRFLSPTEEAKLMNVLGPIYAPYARFAILTGLRRGEQFTLQWDQVDLERSLLTLPLTKAGEVQYLPLNAEAGDILKKLKRTSISTWVFPGQNRERPLDPHNFMRLYRAAVIDASIEWVSWHDLRHTFASRLAMQGVPMGTIAALLRHSTTALVKRYAHLSPAYLAGAIEEISRFGKSKRKKQLSIS